MVAKLPATLSKQKGKLKAFRISAYRFPKGWIFRSHINVSKDSPRNPQNNPIAEVEVFAVNDFMAVAVVPLHK
jgi:hypothetical protein